MSNFDHIDNYLTNRLSGEEKIAFEKQLEADPTLKQQLEFQQQIVHGVKQARIAELKAMLNNVPVSAVSTSATIGKIGIAIVTAGLIGTALYYTYFDSEDILVPELQEEIVSEPPATPQPIVIEKAPDEEPESSESQNATSSQNEVIQKVVPKTSAPIRKPTIEVVDPSADLLTDNEEVTLNPSESRSVSVSQLEVEADNSNKKYNFHYQFVSGKLMLYGSFDKSLYEILEINGSTHSIFLYYKDSYYLLDEKKTEITKLSPVEDSALIRLLKEYRNK